MRQEGQSALRQKMVVMSSGSENLNESPCCCSTMSLEYKSSI